MPIKNNNLEKEMETIAVFLPRKSAWTEKSGGLQFLKSQKESDMTERLNNNNQLFHLPRNTDNQKGAHLSVYLGKYPIDKLISGHWGISWEETVSAKSEFCTDSNNEERK